MACPENDLTWTISSFDVLVMSLPSFNSPIYLVVPVAVDDPAQLAAE
jgi:hypothetical protein